MKEPKEQVAAAIIRARADLEQALSDLEKLPPFDTGTVSFIAHALNNFLTVTGGAIDLLMMSLADHPDPQVHVWLENLEHATGLMTRAVSQLMSKEVTAEKQLRFEKVDAAPALHRLCAHYQPKANQKQLRIICGPFVDLPPVWTDRIAAAAVLDNLISNAMKFSYPSKDIYIKAEKDQDNIVFSVCDEGPGLTQEEQAQLFQRGVRLSPQPTGGEPSSGYGLAVARELVEQLGGTIWCVSEQGKGSCFSFRLPIYQEKARNPKQSLIGPNDVH